MAQVLAALLGAVIGVPLGLGLFKVATGRERRRYPRRAVARCGAFGTLIVLGGLTSVPARIGSR